MGINKNFWYRLFGFQIGDRVRVKRTVFPEQYGFVGKVGKIMGKRYGVTYLESSTFKFRTEKRETYAVQLDSFREGERIWVIGEWLEIE